MMPNPTPYSFRTEWHLEAPLPAVWDLISKPLDWPQWWPGVVSVRQLKAGDAQSLGSLMRYTWKSWLPYKLCFDLELKERIEEEWLHGQASGDLEGWGDTRFFQTPQGTRVLFQWEVRTSKKWMNLAAPLLKPIFAYNHRTVMRWGAKGLARRLHCRLLAS